MPRYRVTVRRDVREVYEIEAPSEAEADYRALFDGVMVEDEEISTEIEGVETLIDDDDDDEVYAEVIVGAGVSFLTPVIRLD